MEDCLQLAVKYHTKQIRKYCGVPYVVHPIRVAELSRKYATKFDDLTVTPQEIWCAAILHDTKEDTKISDLEIITAGGLKVLELVNELTSNKDHIKACGGKAKYLSKKISDMSREARLIKWCDRLDNISDSSGSIVFASRYARQTLKILDATPSDFPIIKKKIRKMCQFILLKELAQE